MAANVADPFLDEVKRLWLGLRRLKLTVCHEIACLKAAEQGWEIRSRKTCERAIAKIPKAVALKLRFGEEAFVNEAEPYIERDYTTLRSNEIWCGDHHRFDVMVNADGKIDRPWLTAWQDMRSRKIVGWRIFAHDPNSDTILQALKDGCLNHGVPESVYIDNGKDYDARSLTGLTKKERREASRQKVEFTPDPASVFPALDIKVIHCWIYHGQSKPIERFFGTVETRTPVWPTYCGKDVLSKPEDLQKQIDRGNAPTLEEFSEWFSAWVNSWNASHEHSGQGMNGQTPDAVFSANLSSKRTAPAELLEVLMLPRSKPVTVGQNGVTLDGLRYGSHEPALFPHQREKVTLAFDHDDRSRVMVFDAQGKFICVATANEQLPANATSQEIRDAVKVKGQGRKRVREYIDQRPRMVEDLPDLLVRARARKQTAATPSQTGPANPPPSLVPIRTPLEAQLPAIQRVLEAVSFRKAVGAEGAAPADVAASLGGKFLYRGAEAIDCEEPASECFAGNFRDMMAARRPEEEEL